jgi:hypothetical protein
MFPAAPLLQVRKQNVLQRGVMGGLLVYVEMLAEEAQKRQDYTMKVV